MSRRCRMFAAVLIVIGMSSKATGDDLLVKNLPIPEGAKDISKLAFSGPNGSLIVQLKAAGNNTSITLISRDAQAAKAAGLLPAPGKARLLIGNDSEAAATVTINKRDYNVAAGAGAKDPKTGLNYELAPGKYTVEVKLQGGKVQTDELTIGADETWGVIVIETKGFLAMQLY